MKYIAIAAATLCLMGIARVHVHHNVSSSLPVLWDWVWQDVSVTRGDIVEVCPPVKFGAEARERGYVESGECPGGTIPFLKMVAAVRGDVVMIDARGIRVNGRLLLNSAAKSNDRAGRRLAAQPYGIRVIPRGFIWLYGTDAWSADSRYYGQVPAHAIRYHARPLVAFAKLPDLR